ncbi:MAG: hypothetical protein ACTHMQ_05275 [Protaetiibacter sp.]
MATGDKASAKGLSTWANTQDHSEGYENDNQRGDELADEIDARIAGDNARQLKVWAQISSTQPTDPDNYVWFKPL